MWWAMKPKSIRRRPSDAEKIIEGRWLTANAVVGLYPAQRVGDDIVLYADETRQQQVMIWYGLRQQTVNQTTTPTVACQTL